MAWGGGGMFGGGMTGVFGGGGNANQAASDSGLPFAGIPPELRDAVGRLTAAEPDHHGAGSRFSHQNADTSRLTLRRMFRPHWPMVALSVLLVVVEAGLVQLGPLLTKLAIDEGVVGRDFGVIKWLTAIGVLAVLVTVLANRTRQRTTAKVSAGVMYDLRIRVFKHLQRQSVDYYTDEKAGVVMSRMTSDVENLQALTQDGLVQFAMQGLTMVFVTAILFSLNVELALVTVLLIVPPLLGLSLWFRAASDRGYLRVRDGIANVLSDLSESLAGVRVVASHNRQARNIINHRNVAGDYRQANFYTSGLTAIYGPGTEVLGFVAQALVLLIGGNMALDGRLEPGELVAFVLYLNSFFAPIQGLVQLYTTYQQGQASITKLGELLATEPTVVEAPDARELPPIEGEVRFESVTFGYDPAVPVLHDVDLVIRSGETVCFVGPTGAGKSTVTKLITRFYDPSAGRVLIDGHDLRGVTLFSLRHQLGVVPQEPFLFAGSIRDNLAFARPDASDEEVEDAIERVGLRELIDHLPLGLHTPVHERGVSLSSGERQLLALGRAFLAHPRVLVLDEATSNLDLRSEGMVEAALDVLLEGRTAIIVAHRLSTAMKADRIVVVDGGRIVEDGPHAELVARGGRYAEMFESWNAHLGGAGHEPAVQP